jgi:hypothetical protein
MEKLQQIHMKLLNVTPTECINIYIKKSNTDYFTLIVTNKMQFFFSARVIATATIIWEWIDSKK